MAADYDNVACLNPVGDFEPRAATVTTGYGGRVFKELNFYWYYDDWEV